MVGDDQVDAGLAGPGREGLGPDAAIDADDEAGAAGPDDVQMLGLDAVAVLQPLGNEVVDVAAQRRQGLVQHDRREDPVHVVVAEDEDLLPGRDGRLEAPDGGLHVLEKKGVEGIVHGPAQEPAGRGRVAEPAVDQGLGQGQGKAHLGRDRPGRIADLGDVPAHLFHGSQFITSPAVPATFPGADPFVDRASTPLL
jgi:hypothetical protein